MDAGVGLSLCRPESRANVASTCCEALSNGSVNRFGKEKTLYLLTPELSERRQLALCFDTLGENREAALAAEIDHGLHYRNVPHLATQPMNQRSVNLHPIHRKLR